MSVKQLLGKMDSFQTTKQNSTALTWSFKKYLKNTERNKRISRTEAWMEDRSIRGNYIFIFKLMYDFASCLLICPVYLRYDSLQNLYVVHKCNVVQRSGCIGVLILSSVSAYRILQGMKNNLFANAGYIGAYFDFANGVILHVYLYTLVYFHWFRLKRLKNFVLILQTSSLIQFSTLGMWKAKSLPTFFWLLTIYMAFIWLVIVFGFDPTSLSGVLNSSVEMSNQIFKFKGINEPWSFFIGILALIGRFYNGFLIHLPHNVFGPSILFCMHFVSKDFFRFVDVQRRESDVNVQVFKFYACYKELIDSANEISGQFSIHFILMMLSYHSVHLFDALNTPSYLWKLNTCLYLLYLANVLLLPASTLLLGRSIKKWLWEKNHYMRIPKQQLSLCLYDLSSKRLGVKGGKFFILSSRFSGLIIQHLLSYSMLNTINLKRLKA